MAGILKNQILKHLSRYVKNLSSDRMNLSTLKGEGELTNLELDENVLTDLLALPTWLTLTRAVCNRVLIRIQWTRLKNVPIFINLDEVYVQLETCEQLRQGQQMPANAFPQYSGKYGFVNKVIDGITVTVNSVEVNFKSKAFETKVQISRMRVESRSPQWRRVELPHTRLKSVTKGKVLIFKELEWQTLRIESKSTSDLHIAPIRLLTNQAKAQIVLKKNLNDSQVVGCRLTMLLDDLLWVLTDSQILATLHFIRSLSGHVKKATERTQRIKAARKLETIPEYQAQLSQSEAKNSSSLDTDPHSKAFDYFDVKETSYHLLCEKIDLHFCDDPGLGRSQHPDLKDGGALQLSITQAVVDFYPYHLARGVRKSWPRYKESNPVYHWLKQSITAFRMDFNRAISNHGTHAPLSRSNGGATPVPLNGQISDAVLSAIHERLKRIMTSSVVVKIQDIRVYKVTTSSKSEVPHAFFTSYMQRPKDVPTVHLEYTWFYHPGEAHFPVPSPKMYGLLHPVQVQIDILTLLWLNSFAYNLQYSLPLDNIEESDYVDIRLELIQPKIILQNKVSSNSVGERPCALHIQASKLTLSNFRSNETGTLLELTQCLEDLQGSDLVFKSSFPSLESDLSLVSEQLISHAEGNDNVKPSPVLQLSSYRELAASLMKDLFWTESRTIWSVKIDQAWADFHTKSASSNVSRTKENSRVDGSSIRMFLDAMPITVWMHMSDKNETTESPKDIQSSTIHIDKTSVSNPKGSFTKPSILQAVVHTKGVANVQLDHHQYIFLMRLVEVFAELSAFLGIDKQNHLRDSTMSNIFTVCGLLPVVKVSFLFPYFLLGNRSEEKIDRFSTHEQYRPESEQCQDVRGFLKRLAVEEVREVHEKPLEESLRPDGLCQAQVPSPSGYRKSSDTISSSSTPVILKDLSSLSLRPKKGTSPPDSEIASTFSFTSSNSSENNSLNIMISEEEQMKVFTEDDGELKLEGVEIVKEALEDNELVTDPKEWLSPSKSISSSVDPMYSQVQVLSVTITGIEFSQESQNLDSLIKFICSGLVVSEELNIKMSEWMDKFSSHFKLTEAGHDDGARSSEPFSNAHLKPIRLRLAQTVNGVNILESVGSLCPSDTSFVSMGKKHVKYNQMDSLELDSVMRNILIKATKPKLNTTINLEKSKEICIHSSSMKKLVDFIEDEIAPEPLPMELSILMAKVKIIEDSQLSPSAQSAPPVLAKVPYLMVSRGEDGAFVIGHQSKDNPAIYKSRESCDVEEQELKARLKEEENKNKILSELLEKSKRRFTELETKLEENNQLKSLIIDLQEQVEALHNEKFNLIKKFSQ